VKKLYFSDTIQQIFSVEPQALDHHHHHHHHGLGLGRFWAVSRLRGRDILSPLS
jgi:hypothetical protein